MNLHPDDVLFFHEVVATMKRVAKHYDLPLRTIAPVPEPEFATSSLGYCSATGDITLTLRGMRNGVWDEEPRREEDVWNTAAHELAHLRHFNHGVAFQEFDEELRVAIRNMRQDHIDKVLARLVKLQASREGEAAIGNTEAAEAFASMINKMLVENELNPSDIDYARANDNDPVVEIRVDLAKYRIKRQKTRIAWQESLASIVARAHLCSLLIVPGSNVIIFVGTRSHALVAEYAYGILCPATHAMADKEYHSYRFKCEREGDSKKAYGYRPAWLAAFLDRIKERFDEVRTAAVAESTLRENVPPDATSTALVRLNGAMTKVRKYMDDKFEKKRKWASQLNGGSSHHADGRAHGSAAADRMVIGRKGVTGGRGPKGLLS